MRRWTTPLDPLAEQPLPSSRRGRRPGPVALTCLVLALALVVSGTWWTAQRRHTYLPLQQSTVAVGAGGSVVGVPQGAPSLLPGFRVVAGVPGAARYVDEQRRWLRAGTIPSVPELGRSSMVRDALLDLHLLTLQYGVTLAGWSPAWRYVWPRDSAFVAAAFARTGHFAEATALIDFLQRVQPADGVFQARYLPDGSGVPDDRGTQTDGLGWALWGMAQVAEALPPDQRHAFVQDHRRLLDRSTESALALVANPRALPPPSADYWEVDEGRVTLSTAALLLAGLRSASHLHALLHDTASAARDSAGAAALENATMAAFGPRGFPRRLGGNAGSVDLGVSFLLPPFEAGANPAVQDVWRSAPDSMSRPAGGLAPGGSWRNDGISWTTSTCTYLLTAAYVGDRATAVRWLRWVDEHRTDQGSIPEKVLYDGRPASVAPLAWSAAAVVLAADQLAN